jgi:hypothetical protein
VAFVLVIFEKKDLAEGVLRKTMKINQMYAEVV